MTPGHEASGIVRKVGARVTEMQPGSRVFVHPILVCGHCAACAGGRPHVCPQRQIIGVDRDGAFAEFVAVPATNLVSLPDSIPLEAAAMIEPASTAFHALAGRAPSFAGEAVAIVGVGGLGLQAVALASLLGAAAVVAVDLDEPALERALERGATAAYDARDPGVARLVRTATGGGVAVAVECVGNAAAFATAFACLRRGGTVVVVGVGHETLAMPLAQRFVAHEYEARGSFAYSRDEIDRVIRLADAGRLDLGAAIGERFPLDAINDAVARSMSGAASPGRVLVASEGLVIGAVRRTRWRGVRRCL